ncbi:MAG: AbrB/MazE/SpoVT family DNA-binding domain-containing protein [Anaerolineales bacterium]|nr:AbrB/MazE/SpoVT family DNA-binding domain-containing protein [Anaerolineales bacterium]
MYNPPSFYTFCNDWKTVETVTVSLKYQVVIPRKIRDSLNIKPG